MTSIYTTGTSPSPLHETGSTHLQKPLSTTSWKEPDSDLDSDDEGEFSLSSLIDLRQFEMRYNPHEFPNVQAYQQMYRLFAKYSPFICKIETPEGNGTGCLVGDHLILTNHHVLPQNLVEKSRAIFFDMRTGTTPLEPVVEFDPYDYTYSSKTAPDQFVDSEHLDYVIVGLKPSPALSYRFSRGLTLFNAETAEETKEKQTRTLVLGCPTIRNDISCTVGIFGRMESFSLHYNALTAGGNSGGAVMDLLGRFVALHYRGNILCDCISNRKTCSAGVLSRVIAQNAQSLADRVLKSEKEAQEHKMLAIQNLLPVYQQFVGKKRKELLHTISEKLGASENKRVTLKGPEGMGKTALAIEYVFQNRVEFKQRYFIQASSHDQLIHGLLDLANDLHLGFVEKSSGVSDQDVLDKLTQYLAQQPAEGIVLIFGHLQDDVYQELQQHIPPQGGTVLFALSSTKKSFDTLSIDTGLEREDAVDFISLLTPIEEEEKQAIGRWAEKLKGYPVSLRLAAQLIALARTIDSPLSTCFERLEKHENPSIEQSVSLMWQLVKERIPQPILTICQVLSFFDSFHIPTALLQFKCFETEEYSHDEIKKYLFNLSFIFNGEAQFFSCCSHLMKIIKEEQNPNQKKSHFAQAIDLMSRLVRQFDHETVSTWAGMKELIPHCKKLLALSQSRPFNRKDFLDQITYRQLLFLYIQLGHYYLHVLTDFTLAREQYTAAISLGKRQNNSDRSLLALAYYRQGQIAHEKDESNEASVYYDLAQKEYAQRQSVEEFFLKMSHILLKQGQDRDPPTILALLQELAKSLYAYIQRRQDNLGLSSIPEQFTQEDFYALTHQLIHSLSSNEQTNRRRKKRLVQMCTRCWRELIKVEWDLREGKARDIQSFLNFKRRYYELAHIQKSFYGITYHPDVIRTQQYIADLYLQMGPLHPSLEKSSLDLALKHYMQILNDQYCLYLTDRNSEIAIVLAMIGLIKLYQNDSQASLDYGLKALDMKKTFFGDYHSETAYSCFLVGEAYETQDVTEALNYYNKFLEIADDCLGSNQGQNFRDLPSLKTKVQEKITKLKQ